MTLQSNDYRQFLDGLKQRIRTVQVRAALAVNQELIMLYWHIGKEFLARQEELGWGSKITDQLSKDLSAEFPDMQGFSWRNLEYMRAIALAYPEEEFAQ